MNWLKLLLFGLLLLCGCAVEPYRLELPENHPANAAAPQAPLPPSSTILTEEDPALEPASQAVAPMGGHPGHGGMHHGMHH